LKQSDPVQERLLLLKRELQIAGMDFKAFLPKWARIPKVRDAVLNELMIALDAHVHEGLIPPYTSIMIPKDAELDVLGLDKKDLELARSAADGSSAGVVFREADFLGLLLRDPANTPELELAELTDRLDAIGMRRDRNWKRTSIHRARNSTARRTSMEKKSSSYRRGLQCPSGRVNG
jgi:hypothetical protein